jgi:hypothetical protein
MTLQQQWDIWLAANFAKHPNKPIHYVKMEFCKKMDISPTSEAFVALDRLPEGYKAIRSNVTRFVCGHISGASGFMFDDSLNTIQKAIRLGQCKSFLKPVDDGATALAEKREMARANRASRLANDEMKLGNLQRDAYGRRNWSACK